MFELKSDGKYLYFFKNNIKYKKTYTLSNWLPMEIIFKTCEEPHTTLHTRRSYSVDCRSWVSQMKMYVRNAITVCLKMYGNVIENVKCLLSTFDNTIT